MDLGSRELTSSTGSDPALRASPLPKVVADGCLVEPLPFIQELGDVLDIRGQQLVLNEILDALEMTQHS